MSAPPEEQGAPITDRRDLVAHLEGGCKPKADWRIGTEHEKFVFTTGDLRPLPYEGRASIRALLEGMAERFDWTPVLEDGRPIALKKGKCSITLEPGGQFELSGAPLEHVHATCREVQRHLAEVRAIAEPLGVGMLGMGFQPLWARGDIPWMPKGRYKIMGGYMPKVGSLGLDMMLRTCTIQANYDFASEADMVQKMRVTLALQPVATALFANSPFTEGEPNGFVSYRSHIWTDTDPDRTGMLDFVFEDGFGFERYVEHVLGVPMYFAYRDGRYLDLAGKSFVDFMNGRLEELPGEAPTITDWGDHLTTLFPEVRLKRYIEVRGADGGAWREICGLPAFWAGLIYDDGALDAAADLVKDWTIEEMARLRAEVPRQGLQTPFRGGTVLDLACRTLELAAEGLKRRAVVDLDGLDERKHLASLYTIVERGVSPARVKLDLYHGKWEGRVEPVFEAFAY